MCGIQGDFSLLAAHDLSVAAIKTAIQCAGIAGDSAGDVLIGNSLIAR